MHIASPSLLPYNEPVNNTKKLQRKAQQIVSSLPDAQQRHYAVWRYMHSYNAPISEAYQHVYKCSKESAYAASSRLQASPEWHALVDRMENAVGLSADDVRAIVSSQLVSIATSPDSDPANVIRASEALSKMYGLNEQKVTVSVDPVSAYAQQRLAVAQEQPLLPFAQACIPIEDDDDPIDI